MKCIDCGGPPFYVGPRCRDCYKKDLRRRDFLLKHGPALLAAVEEILPCCIDEWGRDDPDVEALIKAVAAAKGEAR